MSIILVSDFCKVIGTVNNIDDMVFLMVTNILNNDFTYNSVTFSVYKNVF